MYQGGRSPGLHQFSTPPPYGGPPFVPVLQHPFGVNPRRDQQPRRGRARGRAGAPRGPWGGRGEGPQRFHDSLENLPVPPGALKDPWEALNAQYGGPQPLEAPSEEILVELKLEVARQIQLQRMFGHCVEPTEEEVPASEDKMEQQQQQDNYCEDENTSGGEGSSSTPRSSEGPSRLPEVPPPQRGRPLVLPLPILEYKAAGKEGDGSGVDADSDRDRVPLRLGAPGAGGGGFQLPAVTGGAPEASLGTDSLTLDEECIKKRLRSEPPASGNGPQWP